ncbi:MAG: tRNA 2-thiouridine(34) synthase MnmA [Flavobacteriaceae bacterium]|nr:tRNA 2-thiouridine(34) synthase MnmA [Flavobacteriaceae bacterium]MCY4216804.1 tRNA 2-thiouridine(34) synthase MnmA [Flavobacteriaceae bacterium]MCY4253869.1 tRNA 2-thiouridine(34) synthase MnmA [Flavobacteriaceae bacterium]
MNQLTVVVGLSGGVDSSVAALLLKKQGYRVIGLFMKNWHDTSKTISNECPWLEDSYDAMMIADRLGIPFQTIDFSGEYQTKVIDYMFEEYRQGRTPNPDVVCNKEIKFDLFLKAALDLDADFIATGHYCRKKELTHTTGKKGFKLLTGIDKTKDQSYFLCQLTQKQLSKVLFPIGHLKKSEVRSIAKENNLVTAEKKDSQGLCFVGKVKLPEFLKQKLKPKIGEVIEIQSNHHKYNAIKAEENPENRILGYHYYPTDGQMIGHHQGAHFYTIGQRKGFAIGGNDQPLFVIGIDTIKNIVYMGKGKNHPGLYRQTLLVESNKVHWIAKEGINQNDASLDVLARIRYRQALEKAKLFMVKNGLMLWFERPQFAITQGQFVAWYEKDELIGSGVIA